MLNQNSVLFLSLLLPKITPKDLSAQILSVKNKDTWSKEGFVKVVEMSVKRCLVKKCTTFQYKNHRKSF